MKKKRKLISKANVMQGYDEKGNLVMYYWQKDSIKTRWGFGNFKVKWSLRFNPIWRIKQWWYFHKRITFRAGEEIS